MDGPSARQWVTQLLRADHDFNDSLGISLIEVEPGTVTLGMSVAPHMVNSQGFCHGGMMFSLADTACAYAVATGNVNPATLDASISFLEPAGLGDELSARAEVIHRGRRVTRCTVTVRNAAGTPVAIYQASCFNRSAIQPPAGDNSASAS